VSLRELRNFVTSNASQLAKQLLDFERNVVAECDEIRASFAPLPVIQTDLTLPTTGAFRPGQAIAMLFGTPGTILIEPSGVAPAWLIVVRKTTTVFGLQPIGCKINGATLASLGGTIGVSWVYFDGKDFWV
jgi:hypothetical protein